MSCGWRQDGSSGKDFGRFVEQAPGLQVGRDEMPHLAGELIVEAQVKKSRLGSKCVSAVANSIFDKAKTLVADGLDGSRIEKQSSSDIEGDGVAV